MKQQQQKHCIRTDSKMYKLGNKPKIKPDGKIHLVYKELIWSLECFLLIRRFGVCDQVNSNQPDQLQILARILKSLRMSREVIITPDRWQSKTLIPSTNVDQKSLEQSFRLPFVASRAANGKRKHCF